MNITKILFFATAITMLLLSCEKEDFNEVETTRASAPGISYTSIYLEDDTVILTRATEDEEERKINNLSFFIFNADGTRDANYGYHTFPYTGNQYTFAVTSGEEKSIIAAGNLQHIGNLDDADIETVRSILTKEIDNRRDVPANGRGKIGEVSGIQAAKDNVKVIKMSISPTYMK